MPSALLPGIAARPCDRTLPSPVIVPFYHPTRRSFTFALLLVLAFVLLLFTGLGVFRLYFDFDWLGSSANDGELFSLKIRGGNSFNLFMSGPLGPAFWATQAMTLALALLMPYFRPIGAALLALATAIGVFVINYMHGDPVPKVPVEFELLTIFVLFSVYLLLSYFGEVRDRKKFAVLMSQYVPPELASLYTRDPESMGMEGEAREISVLFCDVVGFTAITENLDPQSVARWLNRYFTLVSKIVVRHEGTIDKYIGDSVMAFWGAPAPSATHAHDALSAAMDICAELEELNQYYRNAGLPEMSVGIGVSTGSANVGNLGSEYRMAYTAVGDSVNIAQRIEEKTRRYGVPIIVAGETAEALPDVLFRELDTVEIRGRKKAVVLYQPLASEATASTEEQEWLASHRRAMQLSKNRQWDQAEELFRGLRDEWGPTSLYDMYLRGIEEARRN